MTRSHHKRCYECKEVGHYIADCPQLKNKEKEEKWYKEKSKDYKNKYQGHALVSQEWESSHEDSDHEGMATLAIPKSSWKLFNNISDDEDDAPFYLMARGTNVQESSISSSHLSTTSSSTQNDFDDEEEQHRVYMIKEFGKIGFKEIKKLMEKLEKKEECLDRQEDLLILEKERNLTLDKALAEEKIMVEKLAIDLSLANDSNERMSKKNILIRESLASLKSTHSELQESFSCLTVKYNELEVNYNFLWESSKTNSKAT
jgi:hypothetical protein